MIAPSYLTLTFAAFALADPALYRYDACFTYSTSQPPLNDNPDVQKVTLEQCAYVCSDNNFFGIGNQGNECYCGNVTSTNIVGDRSCYNLNSFGCDGDATELCGAPNSMPVFVKVAQAGDCSPNNDLCSTITASNSVAAPTSTSFVFPSMANRNATTTVVSTAVVSATSSTASVDSGVTSTTTIESTIVVAPTPSLQSASLSTDTASEAPSLSTTTSEDPTLSTTTSNPSDASSAIETATATNMTTATGGSSSTDTSSVSIGGAGRSGSQSSPVATTSIVTTTTLPSVVSMTSSLATGLGPVMSTSRTAGTSSVSVSISGNGRSGTASSASVSEGVSASTSGAGYSGSVSHSVVGSGVAYGTGAGAVTTSVVAQSTCIMRSALVDARGYTVSIFPANGTMPTAARMNATLMA